MVDMGNVKDDINHIINNGYSKMKELCKEKHEDDESEVSDEEEDEDSEDNSDVEENYTEFEHEVSKEVRKMEVKVKDVFEKFCARLFKEFLVLDEGEETESVYDEDSEEEKKKKKNEEGKIKKIKKDNYPKKKEEKEKKKHY
jgi:hypothetical protein